MCSVHVLGPSRKCTRRSLPIPAVLMMHQGARSSVLGYELPQHRASLADGVAGTVVPTAFKLGCGIPLTYLAPRAAEWSICMDTWYQMPFLDC